MADTVFIDVESDDWVELAAEGEAFLVQNPAAGNMLYLRNAADKPGADDMGGKCVPPYQYYGRETGADAVQAGLVWVRADKSMRVPVDK